MTRGLSRSEALTLWLLVDPVELSALVLVELLWLEPQSNLLFGTLDSVRAVADVAADIDSVVATDGTWGRCERVGSTEDHAAGFAGVTTFPNHGNDWTAEHVCDEAFEEWLVGQIFVVLLEVFLGGRNHLQGNELVSSLLEAADDVADESALDTIWLDSDEGLLGRHSGC